jgi:DNA-binding NtrC family response regulator
VRELRNVIERAMILEDSELITANWLPRGLTPEAQSATQLQAPSTITAVGGKAIAQRAQTSINTSPGDLFLLPPEGVLLESVEMNLVEQAMKRSGGNQTRAAELLGISRDQLRYRLKKLEEAPAAGALN